MRIWKRPTRLLMALMLVVGVAACAQPHPSQVAANFRAPTPVAEDMFFAGFSMLTERYIDAIPTSQLALDGLSGLASIDPAFAFEKTGTHLIVNRDGKELGRYPLPLEDDLNAWAVLTVDATDLGRKWSAQVRSTSQENIYQAVFDGMLSSLDLYSRYAGRDEAKRHRARREGFGGIGIRFSVKNGRVRVVKVTPRSPASQTGIEVGDLIVRIDNSTIDPNATSGDIVGLLRGPVSTAVHLTLERPGKLERIPARVVRDHIVPVTVKDELENGILYLRIRGFNQNTAPSAMKKIEAALDNAGDRLKGIILDLRGNPGGLLNQAIDLANLFLKRGDIVRTRGRHPDSYQYYAADEPETLTKIPLVVLLDGKSASASEVLAAALQDRNRAVLLGTSSFGKGTVQTVLKLPNDGELTMTWSRLIAPSGYAWHGLGVHPNICTSGKIEHKSEDLIQAALDEQRLTAATFSRWRKPGVTDAAGRKKLRATCPPERHHDGDDIALARRVLSDSGLYKRFLMPTATTAEAIN